jgi:hypothetical protein
MGCNDERLGLALPRGTARLRSIEPVVLVVCGGRELLWSARRVQLVLRRMAAWRPVVALLHGGARGADETAGYAAGLLGWRVQVVQAHWSRHGRAAGPLRNARMLIEALELARRCGGAVLVVGLPGGVARPIACVRRKHCARRESGWRCGASSGATMGLPVKRIATGLTTQGYARKDGTTAQGSKGRAHQEGARWSSG